MEIFRDIEGYEGLYQVSNEGRVKSLKFGKERILKPHDNGNGYMNVDLCMDGKHKFHQVHRLVANAFLPNPDGLPQVNHKDEDKTHNNVVNLEWCSHEYNQNYGTRNQRVAEAHNIPVDMLTKSGEFLRQFPSGKEGEKWLQNNGYPSASVSAINKCCKGKVYKSCYGFKWRYSKSN